MYCDVLLYCYSVGAGQGSIALVRCIAPSTAMQHDFSYSQLYSTEALGAKGVFEASMMVVVRDHHTDYSMNYDGRGL